MLHSQLLFRDSNVLLCKNWSLMDSLNMHVTLKDFFFFFGFDSLANTATSSRYDNTRHSMPAYITSNSNSRKAISAILFFPSIIIIIIYIIIIHFICKALYIWERISKCSSQRPPSTTYSASSLLAWCPYWVSFFLYLVKTHSWWCVM